MTRDEFVDERRNAPDFPGFVDGRQMFVVAIDSQGKDTERFVRAALMDYFGSHAAGVRKVSPRPATDEVCPMP